MNIYLSIEYKKLMKTMKKKYKSIKFIVFKNTKEIKFLILTTNQQGMEILFTMKNVYRQNNFGTT